MSEKFVVVSYYTRKTSYEGLVDRFRVSALDQDILPFIEGIECGQTWEENTKYKAVFIEDCFYRFPERDIVFIDIDAIIRHYPIMFDEIEQDIAVHFFKDKNIWQLCSGTLFFKNNIFSHEIVSRWIERNKKDNGKLEQQNLQDILQEWPVGDPVRPSVCHLPPEYCAIDFMKVADPVIEHFQQSRTARAEIKLLRRNPL